MTAQPLPATRPLDDAAALTPRPAVLGRRTAVAALLVGATLNLAEALIGRIVGQGASVEGSLEAWAARPTLAAVGLAVGTVAVPFLLLALVAMAQLVRPRMPRLGTMATVLGYVGSLGFLGIHAVSIIDYAAVDQPDRAAMVALLEAAQNSTLALLIVVPFMLGMAGSVLLSSIGFLRTRVVPIWIPVTLLLFLVLDFGPFSTGPIDPHWLFVAASVGLAYGIAKRTDRQWWTGRTPDEATS
ncbi:hypothetical protein E4P40_23585 [Blastococcus sp. CT_GayMR20]|uniref:hypothetical protein n=1 Tax=Blastococcus sp. CT_GayMR20 TaxID=2559609 RepID=UPI0010736241|nr:hypothetical protein [Blastococcus sp. CT_GayMR20]TFV68346.1 hypothetical protein E4P40_23585 [Blastococcus sp. CT_GayMR20]